MGKPSDWVVVAQSNVLDVHPRNINIPMTGPLLVRLFFVYTLTNVNNWVIIESDHNPIIIRQKGDENMKHIVSFSGGAGSLMAGKRVADVLGKENTIFVFTNTMAEHLDLYRFSVEGIQWVFGERDPDLVRQAKAIKSQDDARAIMKKLESVYPDHFVYLEDGRGLWDIFMEEEYIGNTRYSNCTFRLKTVPFREWLEKNFAPDQCFIHLGFDWTEPQRFEKAVPHWKPYIIEAPMIHEPYLSKDEMLDMFQAAGIETPKLYRMGFPHNNCGGFCVKAGQGQFKLLLENFPDLYAYHEDMEQTWQKKIGKNNTILRDRRGGETKPLSLKEFRESIEKAAREEMELKANGLKLEKGKKVAQLGFDLDDFGGCGCYTGLY